VPEALERKSTQVFFCSQTYNPQHAFAKDATNSLSKLSRDLCKVCFDHGFQIYSDGCTGSKGPPNHCYKCQQGRIYRGMKLMKKEASEKIQYCNSSFIDDKRLNSRANGKTLPRRTSTARPIDKSCKCTFAIVIKVADAGFYLDIPYGKAMNHCYHRRVVPSEYGLPKRLLSEKQMSLIDLINASNCTIAVAQNTILVSPS
jgi:hypothetical protein